MPTGYTAGLLDGSTQTFEQYAKICMRAFGAAMHMRDDPLDSEYRPDTPISYHANALANAYKEIEELNSTDDSVLELNFRTSLTAEITRMEMIVDKKIKDFGMLSELLGTVNAYEPPTDEHIGIKAFMQEQLIVTIESDCDISFYEREIIRCKKALAKADVVGIRKDKLKGLKKDVKYHKNNVKEDTNRADDRNQWVVDFYESVENTNGAKELIGNGD